MTTTGLTDRSEGQTSRKPSDGATDVVKETTEAVDIQTLTRTTQSPQAVGVQTTLPGPTIPEVETSAEPSKTHVTTLDLESTRSVSTASVDRKTPTQELFTPDQTESGASVVTSGEITSSASPGKIILTSTIPSETSSADLTDSTRSSATLIIPDESTTAIGKETSKVFSTTVRITTQSDEIDTSDSVTSRAYPDGHTILSTSSQLSSTTAVTEISTEAQASEKLRLGPTEDITTPFEIVTPEVTTSGEAPEEPSTSVHVLSTEAVDTTDASQSSVPVEVISSSQTSQQRTSESASVFQSASTTSPTVVGTSTTYATERGSSVSTATDATTPKEDLVDFSTEASGQFPRTEPDIFSTSSFMTTTGLTDRSEGKTSREPSDGATDVAKETTEAIDIHTLTQTTQSPQGVGVRTTVLAPTIPELATSTETSKTRFTTFDLQSTTGVSMTSADRKTSRQELFTTEQPESGAGVVTSGEITSSASPARIILTSTIPNVTSSADLTDSTTRRSATAVIADESTTVLGKETSKVFSTAVRITTHMTDEIDTSVSVTSRTDPDDDTVLSTSSQLSTTVVTEISTETPTSEELHSRPTEDITSSFKIVTPEVTTSGETPEEPSTSVYILSTEAVVTTDASQSSVPVEVISSSQASQQRTSESTSVFRAASTTSPTVVGTSTTYATERESSVSTATDATTPKEDVVDFSTEASGQFPRTEPDVFSTPSFMTMTGLTDRSEGKTSRKPSDGATDVVKETTEAVDVQTLTRTTQSPQAVGVKTTLPGQTIPEVETSAEPSKTRFTTPDLESTRDVSTTSVDRKTPKQELFTPDQTESGASVVTSGEMTSSASPGKIILTSTIPSETSSADLTESTTRSSATLIIPDESTTAIGKETSKVFSTTVRVTTQTDEIDTSDSVTSRAYPDGHTILSTSSQLSSTTAVTEISTEAPASEELRSRPTEDITTPFEIVTSEVTTSGEAPEEPSTSVRLLSTEAVDTTDASQSSAPVEVISSSQTSQQRTSESTSVFRAASTTSPTVVGTSTTYGTERGSSVSTATDATTPKQDSVDFSTEASGQFPRTEPDSFSTSSFMTTTGLTDRSEGKTSRKPSDGATDVVKETTEAVDVQTLTRTTQSPQAVGVKTTLPGQTIPEVETSAEPSKTRFTTLDLESTRDVSTTSVDRKTPTQELFTPDQTESGASVVTSGEMTSSASPGKIILTSTIPSETSSADLTDSTRSSATLIIPDESTTAIGKETSKVFSTTVRITTQSDEIDTSDSVTSRAYPDGHTILSTSSQLSSSTAVTEISTEAPASEKLHSGPTEDITTPFEIVTPEVTTSGEAPQEPSTSVPVISTEAVDTTDASQSSVPVEVISSSQTSQQRTSESASVFQSASTTSSTVVGTSTTYATERGSSVSTATDTTTQKEDLVDFSTEASGQFPRTEPDIFSTSSFMTTTGLTVDRSDGKTSRKPIDFVATDVVTESTEAVDIQTLTRTTQSPTQELFTTDQPESGVGLVTSGEITASASPAKITLTNTLLSSLSHSSTTPGVAQISTETQTSEVLRSSPIGEITSSRKTVTPGASMSSETSEEPLTSVRILSTEALGTTSAYPDTTASSATSLSGRPSSTWFTLVRELGISSSDELRLPSSVTVIPEESTSSLPVTMQSRSAILLTSFSPVQKSSPSSSLPLSTSSTAQLFTTLASTARIGQDVKSNVTAIYPSVTDRYSTSAKLEVTESYNLTTHKVLDSSTIFTGEGETTVSGSLRTSFETANTTIESETDTGVTTASDAMSARVVTSELPVKTTQPGRQMTSQSANATEIPVRSTTIPPPPPPPTYPGLTTLRPTAATSGKTGRGSLAPTTTPEILETTRMVTSMPPSQKLQTTHVPDGVDSSGDMQEVATVPGSVLPFNQGILARMEACGKCGNEICPVCGSNGYTYSSECDLNRTACIRQKEDLTKLYDGECIPGYIELVRGEISCEEFFCPKVYNPVCGSNNQTYHNSCELQKANLCSDLGYQLKKQSSGVCNMNT
ncbi:uncharacterized protein [Diadema antillarum]|uniref:uncharacterized protein n=1 Tax=Diadema antillarum TaxID=105358 RepID=UPI003A8A403C